MEEVQSWWEVPAVAHFFYIFRSSFNLFFFEIAELESALLNIQDPDMSISLEQMVTRLLQGCYDEESVNEDNWEEKLHELFKDNFEENENPLGESYFPHLPPRSKIEVIFKLCELRLDVEGALDDMKNVQPEDMQAKCIGKDSQNNIYWYFCNERLYREVNSLEKKIVQPVKNKSMKSDSNKNSRQSAREKKRKASSNIENSWSIACFTVSDWERLLNSLSKSKKNQDKDLSAAMKIHLPVLQERIDEKDRLLRKRFLELAPKRSSSRISKVQETKRLEELKAAEEARKAELKAEKERARKEALLLKQLKESRQKRAEERSRAIEERAERAKLRELVRDDTDSSEEDSKNVLNKVHPGKSKKKRDSKNHSTKRKIKEENYYNNDKEYQKSSYSRTKKKAVVSKSNNSITPPDNRRSVHTYSSTDKQSENGDGRNKADSPTYLLNSCKSNADISLNNQPSPRFHCAPQSMKKIGFNNELNSENSHNNSSNTVIKLDAKSSNCTKTENASPKQHSLNLSNYTCRFTQANNTTLPPRIAIYKSNTSDESKWNAPFDSQRQKVHFLYKSSDSLAPKRIKLEQVNFRAVPPSMKSSLAKENHLYKPVQFITYGKIIPASTMVKLGYKKPPNQPVSS